MKKIIIFLLVLFSCIAVLAQPVTQRGSATITVYDARSGATFNMFMPRYADTTAANTNLGIDSCGAIIYTYNDKAGWFRQCSPKKWVLFGSSGGNNNADTIFTEIPIAVKIDSLGRHIIYFLRPNGLYAGGIVTVDSCMTLDITPPTIVVNYKQYTGLQTIGVVVQAADPSLPRIDRVVMDTSLNIIVIEGMPSATPVPPEYNSFSQVSLAEIPVGAAITCLGNAEIIFDGVADFAGQWTITTSGTGVTSFVNTINPYHLTEASYTVTYSNGYQIIYTKPSGTDTVKATSVLKGFITVVGNFTNQIIGQWYNGSTAVSNQLLLNSYFNVNDSNNYQIFSPQLSAWSWPGGTVYNKLILSFGGSDNSGSNGVYLDWIQIQTGIGNAGNKQYQDSSSIVNGFLTDWYNGVPITRQAVGGGGSVNTIYTADDSLTSDRILNLNGSDLTISNHADGSSQLLYIDPGNFNSYLAALDGTASSQIILLADHLDPSVRFNLISTDGINTVNILGSPTTNDIGYTAGTHTFTGSIKYDSPVSAASTDSVLTWDAASKTVNMRDASSFGSTVFANNGLTKVVDSIQLGGTLTSDVTINEGSHALFITGTVDGNVQITNTGTGLGLSVASPSNIAIFASSTVVAVQGQASSSGIGISGFSGNGYAGYFENIPANTNSNSSVVTILRGTSGTAANGISASIDFNVQNVTGGINLSNQLVSGWSNATTATRLSQFTLTGIDASVTTVPVSIFSILGTGEATFYGGVIYPYVAKTGNYTATTRDYTINVTSNSPTITFPTAIGITGRVYIIKNSGAGTVVLAGNSGQTFDGNVSPTIAAGSSLTIQSNGANWIIE